MNETPVSENIFHDHLDVCLRCRNQPFNLCPAGALALRQQVQSQPVADSGLGSNPMRSFEDSFADVFSR